MLDHWKYDDVDLGQPGEWGPDAFLSLTRLTFLSDAAFDWAKVSTLPRKTRASGTALRKRAVEDVLAFSPVTELQTQRHRH